MHIIRGLGIYVFIELKKTVINLDNDESENDVIKLLLNISRNYIVKKNS